MQEERVTRKNTASAEKNSAINETENSQTNDTPSETTDFIADIKNAAHQAQNDAGFIYEPTSGLYYDSRTGYYYNAEHGLYYDGQNGCYYSYNQAENKFEFHSQVYSTEEVAAAKEEQIIDKNDRECSKRKRLKSIDSDKKISSPSNSNRPKSKKLAKASDSEQKEDGEISDDYDDSDDGIYDKRKNRRNSPVSRRKQIVYDIDDDSYSSSGSGRHSPYNAYSDIAKRYPPSLRIIVQETNIRKLKIGELFLITYKGGSLGREGKHDVIIPDINCSKYHLKFIYDEAQSGYTVVDLGSRNGTFMNGKRMSNAKQESDPIELVHGTVIQIGQTKLLCHIHDGHSTCGQCEPGLLTDNTAASYSAVTEDNTRSTKTKPGNVGDDHKRQLKNLKKRYGLQDEKYVAPKVDAKNDRAEQRRQTVGSSCEHEKTKAASLNSSISSENKGFKMLSKLGWSAGQALGKNSDGLLEPIPLQMNEKNKGLGCESSSTSFQQHDSKQKHKAQILQKTQRRYNASEATVDIFCSDESD
ncbi:angiogenic factor with G patch and FHA domains 1 isoform X2 [Contarinia nasturtii]|uniref:angiogenic factor with G patch and FHA domains 1 isoform X2 n=1 Tax=Contarinia nasturtii TaxID=265458 RepID=UPI0012D3D0F2|nr:angiogenic factor with G patch and FHA domains 1 isoform X2 [Contarinia nasturtii]